jgi:predicted RNA-binding Zn-ribbon protein involved in translation (DUF1610 family)
MSSWIDRMLYARPVEDRVYLVRQKVDATCPECGDDDVRRYPIANQKGPRMITRCQACFHILSLDRPTAEEPWPPYRSVTYDWESSPAERAARDALERSV